MKYQVSTLKIKDLVQEIRENRIDLNPPYQRNFIWTLKNQSDLIDTIIRGWPLPAFFIYRKSNNQAEMVDGQQRSKSIVKYIDGLFRSSKETGSLSFKDSNQESFLNYELPVIEITEVNNEDYIKEFYVLINKKGMHLNPSEVQRSEFYHTKFMQLANELLDYQAFISLDLFTEATTKRLNDRDFVQELLGYLLAGIKDKKKHIETIFEKDISDEEYTKLKLSFQEIVSIIGELNKVYPINKTRLKQKNDFYTLFSFVYENMDAPLDIFIEQYKVLIILDGKDSNGNQFIRPTNEDCPALKKYAENCVLQSNSKNAREARLRFFNNVLKNMSENLNEDLIDIINYLTDELGEQSVNTKKVGNYWLLNLVNS